MNAKKAKKLRRLARNMSGGAINDVRYSAIEHKRRSTGITRDGKEVPITVQSQQAVVSNCGRSTYKQLKRLASPL